MLMVENGRAVSEKDVTTAARILLPHDVALAAYNTRLQAEEARDGAASTSLAALAVEREAGQAAAELAAGGRVRVAVRTRGSFNVRTRTGLVTDIGHRHCVLLQRADGWGHAQRPGALTQAPPRPEGRGLRLPQPKAGI